MHGARAHTSVIVYIIMSQEDIIEVIRRFGGPFVLREIGEYSEENSMTVTCKVRRRNLNIFFEQGWVLKENDHR